jgi:hypothetical protein
VQKKVLGKKVKKVGDGFKFNGKADATLIAITLGHR